MPKPTKLTPPSPVSEQEVLDAPPTKKARRASAKVSEVIDLVVTDVSAAVIQPEPLPPSAQALIAALRKPIDDAYLARLEAAGKTAFSPEQASKLLGIPADPSWSQQWMQELVAVGSIVLPLKKLETRAAAITARYVTPGRNAIKALMVDVYKAYKLAESSDEKITVYKAIRHYLKSEGVTAHADAPNSSLIVRMVFADFDNKQVHIYSRALDYALQWNVKVEDFKQFVKDEGGFEKIRQSAAKTDPDKWLLRDDKKAADELLKEWFEVEQEDPFLTVTMLTRDQRQRLTMGDYKKVVLIASIEHDTMKNYAQCPLTPELDKAVESACFKAAGSDPEKIKKHIERRKQAAADRKVKGVDPLYGYVPRRSEEGIVEFGSAAGAVNAH